YGLGGTMNGFSCLILGLALLWFEALRPLKRHYARLQLENVQKNRLLQKIKAIRIYYPGLQELTPKEAMERFDVETAYNNIGRPPF
ncbi:MAG: hypothetical protein KDD60_13025, partial [Bdellovibrionales bacterium]|nr:hypothetical protein [Bdellovibrionales bacterium]